MTALSALSTAQLRRALELKEKIETLEIELNDILGAPSESRKVSVPRRNVSIS
jgi:hypothetical protein